MRDQISCTRFELPPLMLLHVFPFYGCSYSRSFCGQAGFVVMASGSTFSVIVGLRS